MRSALADNGNDIISGKSERISKISNSVKRPMRNSSKIKLEDSKGPLDMLDRSSKSSRRGKNKDDYFSEVSLKHTGEKIDAISSSKIKESSMTHHRD